ncbi:Copalyl diphosphate synthase [Paramyrothecium foliicola]|nr:Copalyl diphosphate synthase [Paramyrothecium foliicola]
MAIKAYQDDWLEAETLALIRQAWGGYDKDSGAGFMTCAIYDTAWISLIVKKNPGKRSWLFPQSFDYLVRTQSDNGSWGQSKRASQIDIILDTAASLLSLRRHLKEPLNTTAYSILGLEERIAKATQSLGTQLNHWDVAATTHVGFEIIVPTILELLRLEDPSMIFEFGGKKTLEHIHNVKMARFIPESLYGYQPSSAIHSLEAFTGMLDFDRINHHKARGSMMGSPSATAAYLMHCTTWDDEAEAYLRNVVEKSSGKGTGAVPSAFPSMYFEYSWVLSTLLRAGFSLSVGDSPAMDGMIEILEQAFVNGGGIIGFAPGFPADVDDTAKCITCLRRLGKVASPDAMIKYFETKTHFRTYNSERNPSLTANCNVLVAFLEQPDVSQYSVQILKLVTYLCDCWWESDKFVKDKWNLSSLYPSLLIVQALMDLLVQIRKGNLVPLSQDMEARVLITLFQACMRALMWDPDTTSIEETAYKVLILCEAQKLPSFAGISHHIDECIKSQISCLAQGQESQLLSDTNKIWVEKVSYGSPLLTQSYRLAALKAAESKPIPLVLESISQSVKSLNKGQKYLELIKATPLFATTPEWQLKASIAEAFLFQPLLRQRRLEIFPRTHMEPDKYFDLISLTWTTCNNRLSAFASTEFIYEMMVISFLDYQVDEFMEGVVALEFKDEMDVLRKLIDEILMAVYGANTPCFSNGNSFLQGQMSAARVHAGAFATSCDPVHEPLRRPYELSDKKHQVLKTLEDFVSYIVRHSAVKSASLWDRRSVLQELRIFLHAQVTQLEDNHRLSELHSLRAHQQVDDFELLPGTHGISRDSYFRWLHTTSGDHSSCPYSFAFASCLWSANLGGTETFPSTRAKYLAAAGCQHLAALCRMYNDYGSIARDTAEANLNSINFPEFWGDSKPVYDGLDVSIQKENLFELAKLERGWLESVKSRLDDELQELGRTRDTEIWTMFYDVTDLYGQIYIVKDFSPRKRKRQKEDTALAQ